MTRRTDNEQDEAVWDRRPRRSLRDKLELRFEIRSIHSSPFTILPIPLGETTRRRTKPARISTTAYRLQEKLFMFPTSNAAHRKARQGVRLLAAATVLFFIAGGGWLVAQEILTGGRLNSPGDAPPAEAVNHEIGSAETRGARGGSVSSDVTDLANERIIQIAFTSFVDRDRATLTANSEIDLTALTVSNGTFTTGANAFGGFTIYRSGGGRRYVVAAVTDFGFKTITFNTPLLLRNGDYIEVRPGSNTNGVEWDISMVGLIPGRSAITVR